MSSSGLSTVSSGIFSAGHAIWLSFYVVSLPSINVMIIPPHSFIALAMSPHLPLLSRFWYANVDDPKIYPSPQCPFGLFISSVLQVNSSVTTVPVATSWTLSPTDASTLESWILTFISLWKQSVPEKLKPSVLSSLHQSFTSSSAVVPWPSSLHSLPIYPFFPNLGVIFTPN